MSRRNYKVEQSYIDWLKSLGCIMYLPLTSQGAETCLISGERIVRSGNGSFEFDSNEKMYKLKSPSSTNMYSAGINIKLTPISSVFPNDRFSVLCKFKKSSSNNRIATLDVNNSNVNNNSQAISVVFNGTADPSKMPSYVWGYAASYNGIDRRYYAEGMLNLQTALYQPYQPSGWGNIGNPSILFGFNGTINYKVNTICWISEVYLFNEALDLATIRKIQEYDD